jgi:phenylacetate-coenzyme A ligase PaaK-like adenylate-forming protein
MPAERPLLDTWIARKIGLAPNRTPTRSDIEAYQLSALNRTLEHAVRNSSFYREKFGKVKLNSLSELSSLPYTTPEDLRNDPMGMLCVTPGQISRIVTFFTTFQVIFKRVFFL